MKAVKTERAREVSFEMMMIAGTLRCISLDAVPMEARLGDHGTPTDGRRRGQREKEGGGE